LDIDQLQIVSSQRAQGGEQRRSVSVDLGNEDSPLGIQLRRNEPLSHFDFRTGISVMPDRTTDSVGIFDC